MSDYNNDIYRGDGYSGERAHSNDGSIDGNFSQYVTRERGRLRGEREQMCNQQKELQ